MILPCQGQSKVPADLQAAMKQRNDALQRADATTWGRLTSDDFTTILGDGQRYTKAERMAQIKSSQPGTAGAPVLDHETVQLYGNTAVQRYASQGIWVTLIWAKDKSGWRVTAAQVTPMTPDSAAVWHAIEQNNARFSESFTRGDAAAAAANYAPDAVAMFSNSPAVEGIDAIKQGLTQFFTTMSVPACKLTTHDIVITPYELIERGTYEMTLHPKAGTGSDIVDKGKYLTVWELQPDGSWKITRDISNSDLPASK
ncbi:MAG TPA: DUF4440 domain-containing protein [Gemmatimonadales bacterium]|nr:DUF4440 domain-containing protein [Gemmatimonadales bacterium]